MMIPTVSQFPTYRTGNVPWPLRSLELNKSNYGNLLEALNFQVKQAELVRKTKGAEGPLKTA